MKILRETKDMTTEEFAQYKSDRAQASKAASKAMEEGNVRQQKRQGQNQNQRQKRKQMTLVLKIVTQKQTRL